MIPNLFDTPAKDVQPCSGKPASYFTRQMSVKAKAVPKLADVAHLANVPALPTVAEIVKNARVNDHGQVHARIAGVCWYVCSKQTAWNGATCWTGVRNGKLLECDSLEKAAKNWLERMNARRAQAGTAAPAKVEKAVDPMYRQFPSLEAVTEAIKAGMPADRHNNHIHEKRLNLKLNKIGAEWDSDKLSLHFQMDDLLDAGFSQLDLNLKFAKVEYKDRKLEQAQSDYDMDDVGDFGESEPREYPKPLPIDRPPQRTTTTDDTRQESNSQRHYPLPIVLDREQYTLWCHAKDVLGQQGDKNALLALLQKAGIEPR